MNTPENQVTVVTPTTSNRAVVINTLAIAGFIAIVGALIWLAVSSGRIIPGVVNGIGNAAVYLGSVFAPSPTPGINVVPIPSASTTISFGTATTTPISVVATTTATTTPHTAPKPVVTHPGTSTGGVYQTSTTTVAANYYGTGDLKTTIDFVGYLTSDSTETFVGGTTVPSGKRPAVKFTIKNVGTNWTGVWRFTATIPTRSATTFVSDPQQSLAPGESIDYTLGFDNTLRGSAETITISANSSHTASDLNTSNDTASATIDTLGR